MGQSLCAPVQGKWKADSLIIRLRLEMITLKMKVLTAICLAIHLGQAQRWGGSWGAGRRFGSLQRPLSLPLPEPEPEPFGRRFSNQLSSRNTRYNLYRIPFAEPEPEPIARRLSRRIVGNENMLQPVVTSTTPSSIQLSTSPRPSIAATSTQAILPERRKSNELEDSLPSSVTAEDLLFDEIFSDSSEDKSWMIDGTQFDIVPAVPSKATKEIVRVPKEVSEDNMGESNQFKNIPAKFMPVPAVPDPTVSPKSDLSRQPKSALSIEDTKGESARLQAAPALCLDKCVQQFCDPQSDLGISNCEAKCDIFCS